MGMWADEARRVIGRVHAGLAEDATLAERRKAIDAAYPFGSRDNAPYKTWLRARRAYLVRYGYKPRNAAPESPMERMMRRGGQ